MSERDELVRAGRGVLASRKPYAGPGAVGQTMGNESWRIVATGNDCAALSDALDMLERDGAEIARLRDGETASKRELIEKGLVFLEQFLDPDGKVNVTLIRRIFEAQRDEIASLREQISTLNAEPRTDA